MHSDWLSSRCASRIAGIGRLLTLSRSLRVKSRSAVFGKRSWEFPRFKGCAQPNQRMPQQSGFLIRCGVLSNVAGMVT